MPSFALHVYAVISTDPSGAGTTQPRADTTQPPTTSSQPRAGTTQTPTTSPQPGAETTQPPTTSLQPRAETTQPHTEAHPRRAAQEHVSARGGTGRARGDGTRASEEVKR